MRKKYNTRKLLAAVLSATSVLGAASPAFAALGAKKAANTADELPCTLALNTLYSNAAGNRFSDLGNVTRQGDRIEATVVKDGKPVKLSINVRSGAVQEHQS